MEYVFKSLIPFAVAIISWVFRKLFLRVEQRKNIGQKDFELTKGLFANGRLKESLNNFQLSVGFTGLTGHQAEARIVRLLLEQEEPFGLANDYGKGKQFLEPILENESCKKLQLTQRAQKMWRLLPREGAYNTFYFLTAFFALAPLVSVSGFSIGFDVNFSVWLPLVLLLMLSFGLISWLNLDQYASLKAAQRVDEAFKEKDKSISKKDSKAE